MSATAPRIFIDGTEITGLASDLAPVLGGLTVTWGSDSDAEQAGPSTLAFDVLVKKSLSDIQLLRHGANVAVMYVDTTYVFAGRIRRITAAPEGDALRLRVTAADYLSEAESVFVSTNLPEATAAARHTAVWGLLNSKGWTASTGGTGSASTEGQRAQQTYSSIKLLTVLNRYIALDKARYFDASENVDGTPNRKLTFVRPLLDLDPALLDTLESGWTTDITYPAGYFPAPLRADNVLQDVQWSIDADSVTTVVGLSTPVQDGSTETSQSDHDYSLGADVLLSFGSKRTTVESDLKYGGATSGAWNVTLDKLRANYLTTESWWQPSDVEILDFERLAPDTQKGIIGIYSRPSQLVRITDPAKIVPTDYAIQALALGGEIVWTGTEWRIKLTLGKPVKNRKAAPADEYTYADLQAHTNPDIKSGTYATITDRLSYQDFHYIAR